METLLVKLDQDRQTAQWLVLDENGQPHAAMRSGGLDQLKDFSQQRRVVCLLDGSDVLLDKVLLPSSRNRKKILQAIPFALEDELAEDLENLHFALGKEKLVETANDEESETTRQISIPVAVIAREQLQSYLETLAEAGIHPYALEPDILALPLADEQWQVLVHGDTAAVRTGPQSGFSCELENLALLLDVALNQFDPPPRHIQIWNHNQNNLELALQHDGVELTVTNSDQAPIATLARGFGKDAQLNLLQGEYSYKEEYGRVFKNWRVPAVLLGVWILVALIAKGIAFVQLKGENEALDSQMTKIYLQVFPNSKNLYGQRKQLEEKLNSLGGGEDSPLLQILTAVGAQIKAIPDVHIQSVDFNGEALDVELNLGEVQQLEQMRQQLQTQGFTAEIRSAETEGDKVNGQIRISRS